MKQFVIRYFNWKVGEILERDLPENEKNEIIRRINRAVHYCEAGAMTIDEVMKEIAEA